MAVEVTSTPAFLPGPPKTLFEVPLAQAGNYARNDAYSVSADGKRLLANLPVGPNISAPIYCVQEIISIVQYEEFNAAWPVSSLDVDSLTNHGTFLRRETRSVRSGLLVRRTRST